ncbi:MAG: HDOD domain-containing protein [Pseudomonadota bacterium]
METTNNEIGAWVKFLSENEIPVLRQTERKLAEARQNIDHINDREIAAIVLNDPLMTLRVLAMIRSDPRTSKVKEVTSIAHATMMLGINPFFRQFEQLHLLEEELKRAPQALLQMLQVVRRARRAGTYAYNWAVWRYDPNPEEIMIAALLHDVAEILVLCFAPLKAMRIHALEKADPLLRSAQAQQEVLGFPLLELQLELCRFWNMSELMIKLMDDDHAEHPRVKTVKLAADLARHSAHGWTDPALPDDFREIEKLLNISPEALQVRLGLQEGAA